MSATLGPSPGAIRHPQHCVKIYASGENWRVKLGNRVLAASEKALLLEESGNKPVLYFPPQDVNNEAMLESDSQTTCPFKGVAKYFAATIDNVKQDIAWSYPAVYDEAGKIAGYVAFYADRIDIESLDNSAK